MPDKEQTLTFEALLTKLQKQGFVTNFNTTRDAEVKTSFAIFHKTIEKYNKPLNLRKFIKVCLVVFAVLICLEKKEAMNISLSRQTVMRRIEHIPEI